MNTCILHFCWDENRWKKKMLKIKQTSLERWRVSCSFVYLHWNALWRWKLIWVALSTWAWAHCAHNVFFVHSSDISIRLWVYTISPLFLFFSPFYVTLPWSICHSNGISREYIKAIAFLSSYFQARYTWVLTMSWEMVKRKDSILWILYLETHDGNQCE